MLTDSAPGTWCPRSECGGLSSTLTGVKRGIGEEGKWTGPSGIESGFARLLPWTGGLGVGLRWRDDERGCFRVEADFMVSLMASLGMGMGVSRLSWGRSGALTGVALLLAFKLWRDLGTGSLSSPVAGVGAIDEFWPESGSAMVDAEPCRPVKSTTLLCCAGVTSGDCGLDKPDLCRCRWPWAGCWGFAQGFCSRKRSSALDLCLEKLADKGRLGLGMAGWTGATGAGWTVI